MTLMLFMLLQITPSSALTYVDYTGLIHFSTEIWFNADRWTLETENLEVTVPPFTKVTFNTTSAVFWPMNYSVGTALVQIKVCGSIIFPIIMQVAYWPLQPVILPGYVVRLKRPCNQVELVVHRVGTGRANWEIAGTATLELEEEEERRK